MPKSQLYFEDLRIRQKNTSASAPLIQRKSKLRQPISTRNRSTSMKKLPNALYLKDWQPAVAYGCAVNVFNCQN